MNVEAPAAVVALVYYPLAVHFHPAGDAGRNQVAVEYLHQPARHVEQGSIRRQPGRDRGGGLAGFPLQPAQLAGEPVAQFRGEVIPKGDVVPLPVLLIGGVEGQVGHGVIEAQLRHGEGCQFALAEPGQHQRLVNQGPFPPEPLQTVPHFGAHVGVALALPRPLADREGFEQGAFPGDGEQLEQLGLGHRPALTARVGLLVRLRHGIKRVGGESVRLDGPVAEGHQRVAVSVAGAGGHPFGGAEGKPALQGFASQPGERPKSAVGGEPGEIPAGVLPVNLCHPLRLVVLVEGAEMFRQGRRLMIAYRSFGRGHHPGAHQFGFPFEVCKHLAGGGFVSAAGRHDMHYPGAIAVFGDVVRRFGQDAVGAFFPHGQRRRPGLAPAVRPAGKALALAGEDFRIGR